MDADEENISPRSRGVDDGSATRIESAPGLDRRSAHPRGDDEATVLHSMPSTAAGTGARSSRADARTPDGTRVLDPAVLARRVAGVPKASAGREARAPSEPARTGYEPTRVIGQDELEGRPRPDPISLLAAQSRGVDPANTVVTRARSERSPRDDDEATRVASLGAMAELSAGASASPGETSGEDIDIDLDDGAGPVEAASLPQSVVPTEAHQPYVSSLPPSAVPTGAFVPVPMMPPPSSVPTGGFPAVGAAQGRVLPPSAVPTGAYPPVPASSGPTGGHPTVGSGAARRGAARRAAPTGIHGSIDVAHEENRRQAWGFFVGILIAIVLVGAAFGLIRLLMG